MKIYKSAEIVKHFFSAQRFRIDGCHAVIPRSHRAIKAKNKEPDIAATKMVAHTTSTFIRPTSMDILKPIPTMGVPKNSATIAPISASVELIFMALKIKGSAFGRRSNRSVCQ